MPNQAEIDIPRDMNYRSIAVEINREDGRPKTWDAKNRSVEVVVATENPVDEIDWDRWEMVPTVLLMSGVQIPPNRQIVMLDTHDRRTSKSVMGSIRELRVEGDQFVGRSIFSAAEEAQGPALKMEEGHLTDLSVARKDVESTYIPEGQTQMIEGRSFKGPLRVVTKWIPREGSVCPIGADEMAKARAATQPVNHHRKEPDMPDKNKTVEPGRGTQDPAAPQPPANPAQTGLSAADVERMADEKARAEINRREEIRSMCAFFGFDDQARELIDGNKTIDQARAAIMAKQMETNPAAGGVGYRAQIVADERDKFRDAAQDGLLLRAGLHKTPDKVAAGALDLRGYSMVEVAREALRMAGQPFGGDAMQMVGRALTTSDFPVLLGNVANLSVMAGWEQAEESWERWADGSGSVSNFHIHTMARAGETDDLDEIGEDGEYTYGQLSEQAEQYRIATFGKLNKISRQMIINDVLGEITQAFSRRGEAAARKVGDVAYAVLTVNSAMGDNIALFHADHGNLGTGGALGETTVAQAIKLMGLQKDIAGKRRLNISPRYFLAPKTLEGVAEVFFNSNQFAIADTATTRANPYAGTRFERIYEGRLDDDDTAAYYFAGPKGKTVKLFFLNGNRTPYLETKEGWSIDGVEFKTRIDVGGKAVDWRGLVKNAGQ